MDTHDFSDTMNDNSMNPRTKVLLVITQSVMGGAQRHVLDLATNLSQDTFDVVVAAGGNGLLHEKLNGAHVRTIPLPSLTRHINVLGELRTLQNLIRIIRTEKPDVLHLHSSKIGGLGGIAGKISGVQKIIFTLHGWALNENRSFLSKLFIWFSYWATFLLADRVIAVSEGMARQARRFPFVAKKVLVIRNSIDAISFVAAPEARAVITARAEWSVNDHSPIIGTLAELHHIKGLNYAIEAMALLKEKGVLVRLFVAGEGTERTTLEKLIQEKNVSDCVALPGFIDNARTYLKGFDMFILPSLSEALAYAILEAGAAELPVIATNVGGIPEVIEDEKTGLLIPSKNPTNLAQAIEKLIHDAKLRETLGSALKQKVEKEFSLENMLRETVAVYKN